MDGIRDFNRGPKTGTGPLEGRKPQNRTVSLSLSLSPATEPEQAIPESSRHRCPACFKQSKLKKHLIEHMRYSCHSVHEPKCGICKKHCMTLESVREHLTGPLANSNCRAAFTALGCKLCLSIFGSTDARNLHEACCSMEPPSIPVLMPLPIAEMSMSRLSVSDDNDTYPKLVALGCGMVGSGIDGMLDLCGRVCLVNEDEEVIFHSYVKPITAIKDYRSELTGITRDHMVDAMLIMDVGEIVRKILCNGQESTWRMKTDGGKACLLIGHDLEHDLRALKMNYPENLQRATASYRPLLKTNLMSHSLKYLTRTYLGYEIQSVMLNPYENAVAAMRLYKRILSVAHQTDGIPMQDNDDNIYYNTITKKKPPSISPFDSYDTSVLLNKTPDELLDISRSSYKCWCSDLGREMNAIHED